MHATLFKFLFKAKTKIKFLRQSRLLAQVPISLNEKKPETIIRNKRQRENSSFDLPNLRHVTQNAD